MRLIVAVVGKPRDTNLAAAIREYEARAARYWPLDIREVRQESAGDASRKPRARREGERLLVAIPPAAQVVACDVTGRSFTSEQFAEWLQEARERARDVAFVIGGAFGLGDVAQEPGVVDALARAVDACRTSWLASFSRSSCTAPARSSAASPTTSELGRARHA